MIRIDERRETRDERRISRWLCHCEGRSPEAISASYSPLIAHGSLLAPRAWSLKKRARFREARLVYSLSLLVLDEAQRHQEEAESHVLTDRLDDTGADGGVHLHHDFFALA